jgi:TorA maturation chaperone TorD
MTGLAPRFAFAGTAFLIPDADRITQLARDLGGPDWAALADTDGLEPEYNRLFFNPAGTPCPLWQSAHTGEQHLMGEAHLRALEWYRRQGVEPVPANEPADHIGLLLLFFARLIEAGALHSELVQFAADHLGWVPAFAQALLTEARHPFYQKLAQTTLELVGEAAARINQAEPA